MYEALMELYIGHTHNNEGRADVKMKNLAPPPHASGSSLTLHLCRGFRLEEYDGRELLESVYTYLNSATPGRLRCALQGGKEPLPPQQDCLQSTQ